MGIPIWCLIAPMFLVSVRAGLHDVVAQSFYEEPQSSSPAPVTTQSQRPELVGMKEIVLFLTPEQVDTLEAAGAVVQPYPEYDNDFAELQQQFQQSVEQQNVQRYQTWMSPAEVQKDDREIQDYYKLLNIQEINDDLTLVTQSTESTTEKVTTTTPRYKYTKARQQYKEKEYSTPYVPKKSKSKIANQSNNAEAYVRFLPNYEHEVLQMVPYQPLPISPYNFEDMQSMFLQANEDAQRNAYSQANYMAQQIAFNVGNAEAPQNMFIVASTEAQQNAANIEAQNNAFIQANNEAYRNVFSTANPMTQQSAFTQVSTEAYQNAILQDNAVTQQNIFYKENGEVQQNAYAEKTAEAQRTAFSQANTEAQRNAFTQVNTEAQRNAYSQETTEGQRSVNTATNTDAIQNAHSQETTEAQRNAYSQENIQSQHNAHSQTISAAQQNTHSQTYTDQIAAYRVSKTEAPQNAFSQVYTVTQRNAFSQANTLAQQIANNITNTEAPQIAYTQTNTSVLENAKYVANAESGRIVYSQASTLANTEAQQAAYTEASTKAQRTAYTEASTKAQRTAYTEASTKAQPTAYTEASTKAKQKTYSQINRESQRNLYKPSRPTRIQLPKGSKKPQRLEKATTPVTTPRPTGKTYVISQGSKEFKETLSSIEGLPPLLPLTSIVPLEEPQTSKPVVTPAPPTPTVQTNILNQDKLSLLLAPLYQHQTITDSISRQKEELLKNEHNIRTKLQKMKETPQYYNQQEYTAELEKLTRNFGEQNALARIEAATSTVSPTQTVFVNRGSETTESRPIEFVKSNKGSMLVRIPKPHEVKIPVPYPAPIEFMQQQFRVPRPTVGGRRPVDGVRNVYVKVDRPYTIPQYVPYIQKQRVPVTIPITADQLKIIRHIWEH